MTCTGGLNTCSFVKKKIDKPNWIHRESDKFHLLIYPYRVTAKVSRFWFMLQNLTIIVWILTRANVYTYICIIMNSRSGPELAIFLSQMSMSYLQILSRQAWAYYHRFINRIIYKSTALSHCVVNKLISSWI